MEEAGSGGGGLRARGEVAAVAGAGRRTYEDGEIQNGFLCTRSILDVAKCGRFVYI